MKGVVNDVVAMILSVDCQSSAMTMLNFANKKVVILPPMIANLCRSITFVTRIKTFACDVIITKTSVDGVILTTIAITTKGRLVLLVFVENVHLTNAQNVTKTLTVAPNNTNASREDVNQNNAVHPSTIAL